MGNANEGTEAVRKVRRLISREHDNDPRKLIEYYIKLQERHKDRLMDGASQQWQAPAAAPRGH